MEVVTCEAPHPHAHPHRDDGVSATADPGERVSTLADQRAVGITIYNTDLALVRDRRHVTLPRGESHLALREVSGRMRPETALLQSVGAPGRVSVFEQNFNYDLLTAEAAREVRRPRRRRGELRSAHRPAALRACARPRDQRGRRPALRRPHRNVGRRDPVVPLAPARSARPSDAGERPHQHHRRRAGRRADVPQRRPELEGGLHRAALRERRPRRPARDDHAAERQRHVVPRRRGAARRRRRQRRTLGIQDGGRGAPAGTPRAPAPGLPSRRSSNTISTPCRAAPRSPTTRPSRSSC